MLDIFGSKRLKLSVASCVLSLTYFFCPTWSWHSRTVEDACVAIQAAKRHLWKLLMHLWCTLQWLCNRIDEIQEMWDRADQMLAQDK